MSPKVAYRSRYARQDESGWGFGRLPQICDFSDSERERVYRVGELAASIMGKASRFLSDVMKRNDPDFLWLINLMLASVPVEYRDLTREVIIASKDKVPKNFRLDLLCDGTIAEIQCPGSGWGFLLSLEESYGVTAEELGVVSALSDWIGERTGVWWLHNEAMEDSVGYLIKVCREQGIDLRMCKTCDFDPLDSGIDIMMKRMPLPELIASEKGRVLLNRWMNGGIEMDPPASMIFETKYILALLHHPMTRHLFTEEERAICHPTFLVESLDQSVDFGADFCDGPFLLGDLMTASKSGRKYVVKYAGAMHWYRYGGHAVHALNKEKKKESTEALLRGAINFLQDRNEGWIIQPFVGMKRFLDEYGVTDLNTDTKRRRVYVLWRPSYQVLVSGDVRHVGTMVNLRQEWKVHGSSDCWLGICR